MSARRISRQGKEVSPGGRISVVAQMHHPVYRLKNRKRDGGTPDKSSTPSQENIQDENLPLSSKVIWNEEIEKLQIKEEDIPKFLEPQPPSSSRPPQPAIVRRSKPSSEWDQPKIKTMTFSRPAPPDAPLREIDTSGNSGPRYTMDGHVILHSILGSYDDFYKMAVKEGHLMDMPVPGHQMPKEKTTEDMTVKYEKTKPRAEAIRKKKDENNALINWQRRMLERKRQQGYISRLLEKEEGDLAMNQADSYRQVQEQRYLIQRTQPFVEYGSGYRHGSEFWKQPELVGGDDSGIHVTLTQSERGYAPAVEQIGIPKVTKKDKGITWEVGRSTMNYPWHQSQYLKQKLAKLQPLIRELVEEKPDFEELQIIGSNRPYRPEAPQEESELNLEELRGFDETDVKQDEPESEDKGMLESPVFGPSLRFAGQPARWTGDAYGFAGQIGVEARVTFDALTGDRVTSYLEIVNDGTTSIYYNWKKLAKENPFELVQTYVQRFYFNNSSGVLLPGETLRFPFVFKSPNPGMFTEQWQLETRPVVCGGAALIVTLRGIALQEDRNRSKRQEIEQQLHRSQAEQVVRHILDDLVSGIREQERPRSPVDAYITEEEIFRRNNPGLQYNHGVVADLHAVFKSAVAGTAGEEEDRQPQVWDLSVLDLIELVQGMDEDDDRKEGLMQQLNAATAKLTFTPNESSPDQVLTLGRQLLRDALDEMQGHAMFLRKSLGLPDPKAEEMSERDCVSRVTTHSSEGAWHENRRMSTTSSGSFTTAEGTRKGKGDRARAEAKEKKAPEKPAKDAKNAKGGKEAAKNAKPEAGKTAEPKGGKGKPPSRAAAVTPTPPAAPPAERASPPPSAPVTPTPESADQALERKYKEKFYTAVYNVLGQFVDRLDGALQTMVTKDLAKAATKTN